MSLEKWFPSMNGETADLPEKIELVVRMEE